MPNLGPFYDDSLEVAMRVAGCHLPDADEICTYLRDGQGRLHIYVRGAPRPEVIASLERELRTALGGYAPAYGPIVRVEELSDGEASLLVVGDRRVRYVERRFAGVDWTQEPAPLSAKPGRLVFYSIKGGVGRTTALAVLATALAMAGRRVLAVDLDLEAPGLGAALLAADELPEFGALDWLTERAVQPATLPPLDEVFATSRIGRDTGIIDVVPVFGRRCLSHPAGVLSKLSRIVVEGGGPDGQATFGSRVSDLIDALIAHRPYDAVLVDARAGLSEISSAPLMGLGADVLFFMSDNSQSIASYTALLAHLQRFAPFKSNIEDDDDWRLRIKVVRGRVANFGDPKQTATFNDRCYDMFSNTIYDSEDVPDDTAFSFAPTDPEAPHSAVQIAFDPRFQTYEPLEVAEQLRSEIFISAFGPFISWCLERLGLEDAT
jgi:hypothetical protein